jgi:hypothetical protein
MARRKKPPAGRRARRRHGARVGKRPEVEGGAGRPTDLTDELVEAIAQAVEQAKSFRRMCEDLEITPSVFYEWRAKGLEDLKSGTPTVYARLADRLSVSTVTREWECNAAVMRGVTAAAPESGLKGGRATLAVRAGDLAWKVLAHTEYGARGAERRWGPRESDPPAEQPAVPEPQGDIRRLSDEDLDALERLILKMRGAEGAG